MIMQQPRSQSSSAISDVTSPVKLVGKIRLGYRARFQASSGHSDSANWPGYEADYANITQMKSTSQIVAFLKWIVLTVKLNQMKMLKLRLPYLFVIMLRRWTSELKSATRTKSQPLGFIPCYLRAGKHFEPDCLPPMEATDILSYLVLETSYYTQKQFKAFRSLEAYNQMVSGFIASVEGHIVANKFVVLAKVRHSQRMNDSLIPIWIITEREGTILSAHCLGCKAGLAKSCSHIASVLFYLEAWTKINGRLSCTQVKCSGLLPSYVKQVDYARVRDINFTSAKKMKSELDASIDNVSNDSFPDDYKLDLTVAKKLSKEIPAPSKAEMDQHFAELSKSKNKPIALSLIPEYGGSYVCKSRTVPTIKDLFENKRLISR